MPSRHPAPIWLLGLAEHVGTEFGSCDGAAGGSLNTNGLLDWNGSATEPMLDSHGLSADGSRHGRLGLKQAQRSIKGGHSVRAHKMYTSSSIRVVYINAIPCRINFLYMKKPNPKGARFAELSSARGVKAGIARSLNLDLPVINNWKSRGVPPAYANVGAELLKCRPDEISDVATVPVEAKLELVWSAEGANNNAGNAVPIGPASNDMPLISWVKAGAWCESPDQFAPGDAEDWLPRPKGAGPRAFALRVEGDSMTSPFPGQRSYPAGSIIYVDPDRQVTNGCRVVARTPANGEYTFKVYTEDAGKRYLKPINPQYPLIDITDETHICGVVIGSYLPE